MNDKKRYLYQLITSWQIKYKNNLLDLEKLCALLNIRILYNESEKMFPSDELAYYVLYSDRKGCIVIRDIVEESYYKEIITYSILRIELLKRYGILENIQQLANGIIMESFYECNKYVDEICHVMMYELLIPSSELSVSLLQSLNTKKIEYLSNKFQLRQVFVIERCEHFLNSARGILEGVMIRKIQKNVLLPRKNPN